MATTFRGHPAAAPLTQLWEQVMGLVLWQAFRGHPAAAPLTPIVSAEQGLIFHPSAAIRPRPH